MKFFEAIYIVLCIVAIWFFAHTVGMNIYAQTNRYDLPTNAQPWKLEGTNQPFVFTNSIVYITNEFDTDTNLIRLTFKNITRKTNYFDYYGLDYHGTNFIVWVYNDWKPVIIKTSENWCIVFKK